MERSSIGTHFSIKSDLMVNSEKEYQKWPVHYILSNDSKKVFHFGEK